MVQGPSSVCVSKSERSVCAYGKGNNIIRAFGTVTHLVRAYGKVKVLRFVFSCAFGARGGHTRLVDRGWGGGVNILEEARHRSILYICKYFVPSGK